MGVGDALSFVNKNIQSALGIGGTATSNNAKTNDARDYRAGILREPFIFKSDLWDATTKVQISWYANPSEVSWSIPLRGSDQVTKTGRVTHNWPDPHRDGVFYDEPELTFSFQIGNILPFTVNGEGKPVVPEGLDNFYTLIEFLTQPRFQANGASNFIKIFYNSNIFPSMTLTGMFKQENALSFTDSAESPFTVNSLSATFIVYQTDPKFWDAQRLKDKFTEVGFSGRPPKT